MTGSRTLVENRFFEGHLFETDGCVKGRLFENPFIIKTGRGGGIGTVPISTRLSK